MKKTLMFAIAALLGLATCGGNGAGGTATEDTGGGEEEAAAATTVTASNFAFDPTELEVASGATITFVNKDDAEHSFTVDGTDVEEELEEPGEVDVTIDLDAGDYDFYCKYHRDTMTGTLTIT